MSLLSSIIELEIEGNGTIDAMYALYFLSENGGDDVVDKICNYSHNVSLIMKYLNSGLEEENKAGIRVLG